MKLLLLPLAIFINMALFGLMFYLVMPHAVLPQPKKIVLEIQRIALPETPPPSPPALPQPTMADTAEPVMAPQLALPPALPTLPELPALPEFKDAYVAPELPKLALEAQPYLGDMATLKPLPAVAPPAPAKVSAAPTKPSSVPSPAAQLRIVPADRQLLPLLKVEPQYPRRARRRNIEGSVEVEFLINQQGAVEKAQVVQSEPSGLFDEAALKAVRRWKFAPRYIEGQAVYQKARQVIKFRLR